jgi:hypothetical protein
MRKSALALLFTLTLSSTFYLSPFGVNVSAAGTSTVTLHPTMDTFVNSTNSGVNYDGSSSLYFAATTEECFAYMLFDLSILPSAANILSANLSMYLLSKTGTVYMGESIGAYNDSDNDWAEDGITWDDRPSFNSTPTAAWALGGTLTGYKFWDVTVDVQAAASDVLTEVLKFTNKI